MICPRCTNDFEVVAMGYTESIYSGDLKRWRVYTCESCGVIVVEPRFFPVPPYEVVVRLMQEK